MAEVKIPLLKVILDKIVSCLLIILTSPIWLLITIASFAESALSPSARGGLFHTEIRVSAGRPFRLYKFRILKPVGEEAIRAGAIPKNVENDRTNLTRLGAVLKKVGLDELPQLVNILTGRMSFIGPRPKPVPEYDVEIEKGHYFRAQLRAGLSGPMQVMKGTTKTGEERLKADFEYAQLMQNGSQLQVLVFDLKTLWQTVLVILRATGE